MQKMSSFKFVLWRYVFVIFFFVFVCLSLKGERGRDGVDGRKGESVRREGIKSFLIVNFNKLIVFNYMRLSV